MKAMVLERTADVETSPLQLRELPVPKPGPGEVLVHLTGLRDVPDGSSRH